jgi:hypothetical protein
MRLVLAGPILRIAVARGAGSGSSSLPGSSSSIQSASVSGPDAAAWFGVEMRGCDGADVARREVLFHGSFLKAEESRREEELEEAGGGGHGGAACPLVHLAG